MIRIYNFSQGQEDAFLIEIHKKNNEETQEIDEEEQENNIIRILVDGGNGWGKSENSKSFHEIINYCKATEVSEVKKIDYVCVTHIDQDHIRGVIQLMKKYKNEYFNNTILIYNKFIKGLISFKQAIELEEIIKGYECMVSYKSYQTNKGDVIFFSYDQRKIATPNKDLIYITFLSPEKNIVQSLRNDFLEGKKEERFSNKASVMFLLEYNGKCILMTGDGYLTDIEEKLGVLKNTGIEGALDKIDLIKIPHHGSKENCEGIKEIAEKFKCNEFILTNDDGQVKLSENTISTLKDKTIYCNNDISTLTIVKKTQIEIKQEE